MENLGKVAWQMNVSDILPFLPLKSVLYTDDASNKASVMSGLIEGT